MLYIVSGYCANSVLKKLKCSDCKSYLVLDKELNLNSDLIYDHIKVIDRGGLLYPSVDVINAVLVNYKIIEKLCNSEYENKFLKCSNQREVLILLSEKNISN